MSAWFWVVVVAAIARRRCTDRPDHLDPTRRSEQLRAGFGPEYDRTIERVGGRDAAEADLRERQARHDELELRPLAPLARKGYMDAWQGTQAEFVDNPVERDRRTPTA